MDIYKEYNMNRLIICRGLPASGKTTWAKEWVMEDPEHRVRINLDDIRLMLGEYWVPSREELVSNIQEDALSRAAVLNYDIVVDNTNLNPKAISYIKSAVLGYNKNYKIEYKNFFNVSLKDCIKRNKIRNTSLLKDIQIADTVIVGMYERYKDIYNLKAN